LYEDEWKTKQNVVLNFLQHIIIQNSSKKRIEPIFVTEIQTSEESLQFLTKYHYLGAVSGSLTVQATHNSRVVGVWVFKRRDKTTVEWTRACWDHNYKTWNPHEKALKLAIEEFKKQGYTKILSFSDNRFHTGELYEKLGFKLEQELSPNYFYTNGIMRRHKFNFRVPAGVDEMAIAARTGWYRIFDVGKKRFSLFI
jgi:hypothetical protein